MHIEIMMKKKKKNEKPGQEISSYCNQTLKAFFTLLYILIFFIYRMITIYRLIDVV